MTGTMLKGTKKHTSNEKHNKNSLVGLFDIWGAEIYTIASPRDHES